MAERFNFIPVFLWNSTLQCCVSVVVLHAQFFMHIPTTTADLRTPTHTYTTLVLKIWREKKDKISYQLKN